MSMTFSQFNRGVKPVQSTQAKGVPGTQPASGAHAIPKSDDLLNRIEGAKNFNKDYSINHSPEQHIQNKILKSVIFKVKESALQNLVTYHFWKNSYHGPELYIINACTKSRELISISHKSEDLSLRYFKITDDNEVDIIIQDSCRPY